MASVHYRYLTVYQKLWLDSSSKSQGSLRLVSSCGWVGMIILLAWVVFLAVCVDLAVVQISACGKVVSEASVVGRPQPGGELNFLSVGETQRKCAGRFVYEKEPYDDVSLFLGGIVGNIYRVKCALASVLVHNPDFPTSHVVQVARLYLCLDAQPGFPFLGILRRHRDYAEFGTRDCKWTAGAGAASCRQHNQRWDKYEEGDFFDTHHHAKIVLVPVLNVVILALFLKQGKSEWSLPARSSEQSRQGEI